MKMNKADRAAAIETFAADLENLKAARLERAAGKNLADNAMKRLDQFFAYMATSRNIERAVDCGLDVEKLYSCCDKATKRYEQFWQAFDLHGYFYMKDNSDGNRHTYSIIVNLIAAQAAAEKGKAAMVAKRELHACHEPVKDSAPFVVVPKQHIADVTINRQIKIAVDHLSAFGFVKAEMQGGRIVGYSLANAKSPLIAIFKEAMKATVEKTGKLEF